TGGVDQYAGIFCRDGSALLLDFDHSPPTRLEVPLPFAEYGLALLVVDTQTRHQLADGQYGARVAECREAVAALRAPSLRAIADHDDPEALLVALGDGAVARRARHVVTDIARVRDIADRIQSTGPAHDRFL